MKDWSTASRDRLHGSQVSNARPHGTPGQAGAPFDCCRRRPRHLAARRYGFGCRAILHDHIRNEVAVRSIAGSVVL
jgi:hypothetical protein